FGDGKSRVDGKERTHTVDSFEHYFTAASAAHSIAEYSQQFAGLSRLAGFNLDDVIGAGQLFELARLRKISDHELEELGLLERLVAAGGLISVSYNVTRQRAEYVIGGKVRRERGHSRERMQRARNGNRGLLVGGRRRRRHREVAATRFTIDL